MTSDGDLQQTRQRPLNSFQLNPDASSIRPTPDATTARNRRAQAVSRAARAGISNLVESIKISKPPRAPTKHPTGTLTASRRHALIPLAEGRDELEARIRVLEDGVATRDETLVKLKRQLGRELMRRRTIEKERDRAIMGLKNMPALIRTQQEAAISARSDLQNLIADITSSLPSAYLTPKLNSEVSTILDHIAGSTDVAMAKLSVELPTCPENIIEEYLPSAKTNYHHSNYSLSSKPRTTSTAGFSDDDARSCASYASSLLGDNREAQLDSLVELVDILESKINAGAPHQAASNALQRAKRTVSNIQRGNGGSSRDCSASGPTIELERGGSADLDSIDMERRHEISSVVDAVIKERLGSRTGDNHVSQRNGNGNGNGTGNGHVDVPDENDDEMIVELSRTAVAHVELLEARRSAEALRRRVASLEKMAERAIRVDELIEQNAALTKALGNAKSTITRMIREQGVGRRMVGSATLTPASTPRAIRVKKSAMNEDDDVLHRVLVWQQDASTASTKGTSTRGNTETVGPDAGRNDSRRDQVESDVSGRGRGQMNGSVENGRRVVDSGEDEDEDEDDAKTNESTIEIPCSSQGRFPDRVDNDEPSNSRPVDRTTRRPRRLQSNMIARLTRRDIISEPTNVDREQGQEQHEQKQRERERDRGDVAEDNNVVVQNSEQDGASVGEGVGQSQEQLPDRASSTVDSTMGEFGRNLGDVMFNERRSDVGGDEVTSNHSFGLPPRGILRRQNSNASCLSGVLSEDMNNTAPNIYHDPVRAVDGLRDLLSLD